MHRQINLNKENIYYIELYRNRREVLTEIPKEFIKDIRYETNTYPTMKIEIPDTISRGGDIFELDLYEQIKGKMFLIIDINGVKERYIIDEDIQIKETKDGKVKTLTAYGYEKTLEKKTFLIGEGLTRQLYRPVGEKVEVSDGILNFFEEQTGWKVKHVDELARKELGMYYETVDVQLYQNLTINKVEKNTVLFEKDIVTNVVDKALTMTISYPVMKTYDSNNNLLKTETIAHTLTNLPYNIKKLKATYTSDSEELFGIEYELTYENNTTQTKKHKFTNLTGLKVEFPEVNLNYETNVLREHLTTKYRFFEQCSTKWLNFLISDVSEAFDCVFEFDNYNMEISVYAKKTYGTYNGLYLSWDYIAELNKTHKVGEVVSRLYVESPNTSIVEENPLGTEYVECYDYYINSGIMSDSLKVALEKYNTLIEQKQIEFLQVKLEKNKTDQLLTKKNSELLALQERYKAENAILTAYVKDGTNDALQRQQSIVVENLDKEIQDMMSEIQSLKDKSSEHLELMTKIGSDIQKQNATINGNKIFTEEDLLELEDYTIEGAVSNDYYTLSLSLYNHAIEVIKDFNTIYIDFNMSTHDFTKKIAHPDGWQKFIRLGEKIEIDDKDVADIDGFVQLHGYNVNPSTDTISGMTFTNNKKPISDIKTISDIGRTTNKTSNLTDFYKGVWKDASNNNVFVNNIIDNGLDLAAQIVRGKGTVNRIDISESGIYIIDANDENKQLYLGSGLISFTEDRWKTSKLAIDTNGVIANNLYGKVILGNQLYIGNENNTVVINPNGISIHDPNATQEERIFLGIRDGKAKLELHSASGNNKLVLSENGIYQVFPVQARDSFDKDKSFKIPFYLPNSLQRLDEARLILNLEKFRAYSKSMSTQPQSTSTSTSASGGKATVGTTSATGGQSTIQSTSKAGGKATVGTTSATGGQSTIQSTSGNGGYRNVVEITQQGGANVPPTYTAIDPGGGGNPSLQNHVHQLDIRHTHNFNFEIPSHTHSVTVTVPNHTHNVSVDIPDHQHDVTVTVPNHTHNVSIEIPNHTHDVSITVPSHTHNIEYGIFEFNDFPTIDILLDNVPVRQGIYNENGGSFTIDLLNHFNKNNLGGVHTLEIRSKGTTKNPNGLGRAAIDLFVSGFVAY